jgi:hypothetical protein
MSRLTLRALVVAVVLGCAALSPAIAAAADSTVFSGRATVVDGRLAGMPITLVDTGPVAAEGGELEQTLLCYPGAGCAVDAPDLTNGLLQAEVLHAAVVAGGDRSSAEASTADFRLGNVAGNTIEASFLGAEASATCKNGTASITGRAHVVQLAVNGERLAITGDVNQRFDLPGGAVIIVNEQVASVSADRGEITVSALHIIVPGLLDTDVHVARAHADILCGRAAGPSCAKDFVTGGGWILGTPSGERGTLAVAGGLKNGGFWGHLSYIDHGLGLKVKGLAVTAYEVTGPTSRRIAGTARVNGVDGFGYVADVSDNGEPGRADTFDLTLSNGYHAGGALAGGNIQLHCR